jgi:hypothetical protein
MRDYIIAEIRRIAANAGGKAPGRRVFENETGIRPSTWLGVHWARWGDALRDAGFDPNEKQGRTDRDQMIAQLCKATRHFGRVPTYAEMRMFGRTVPGFPAHSTVSNTFPSKADLTVAMRDWIAGHPEFEDLFPILPARDETSHVAAPRATSAIEGFVYLIKSGEFYKVGRSDDAERRFKQITVALPDKAELFHTIRTDDPPGIEAYWHRRFADRRANGEWFKLTPQDVAAFRKRKFQ